MRPHSRNLRLHRLKDRADTFFVTKCVQPRGEALTGESRKVVCEAFRYAVANKRIKLAAFVVMPDHWHGLFALAEGWTLPRFMHAFMSFVAGKTCTGLAARGCAWQDGYYETLIRTAKQFEYVGDYIEWNPVRKGLAKTPEQWDATSRREQDIITHPWPWDFES
jgi:REP element-mobilizing transposase RayT